MTDRLAAARADLELECPPSEIPIGDAVRRLRRRSRLIDWLLTVLIVVTPLAFAGMAVALLMVTNSTEDVGRRADAVVKSNAELVDRLDELEATNAALEDLVESFRSLALARTPEEREAAREALGAITTTTTTARSTTTTPSRSSSSTTSTTAGAPSVSTTTTTAAPPSTTTTTAASTTTTTSAPLIPSPCSIVPVPPCPRSSP